MQRPVDKISTSGNYHNFTLSLLGKDQAAARMAARRNRRERPKMRKKGRVDTAKFVLTRRPQHSELNHAVHSKVRMLQRAKIEYYPHPRSSAEGETSGDKAQHPTTKLPQFGSRANIHQVHSHALHSAFPVSQEPLHRPFPSHFWIRLTQLWEETCQTQPSLSGTSVLS